MHADRMMLAGLSKSRTQASTDQASRSTDRIGRDLRELPRNLRQHLLDDHAVRNHRGCPANDAPSSAVGTTVPGQSLLARTIACSIFNSSSVARAEPLLISTVVVPSRRTASSRGFEPGRKLFPGLVAHRTHDRRSAAARLEEFRGGRRRADPAPTRQAGRLPSRAVCGSR